MGTKERRIAALLWVALGMGCSATPAHTHARRAIEAPPPPTRDSAPSAAFVSASAEEPPIVLTLDPPSPTASASEGRPTEAPAIRIDEICADGRAPALEAIGQYRPDFEHPDKATLADLELESPRTDAAFLDNVGPGYWGPVDIDGDGVDDRIMRLTSVDFWSHFFFMRKGGCLRYIGVLEGYQVEVTRPKGVSPRARVHTYPIGPDSRVDAYAWNGAFFQPLPP